MNHERQRYHHFCQSNAAAGTGASIVFFVSAGTTPPSRDLHDRDQPFAGGSGGASSGIIWLAAVAARGQSRKFFRDRKIIPW